MNPPAFEPAVDATIECSARAPRIARREVEKLAADIDPGVLRDALLLVSELVTNSIKHSGSKDPITVRAWPRRSGLKVEVGDGGSGFDAGPRTADQRAEGGRGLLIVEALADRWGVSDAARTRVWFEVSPRPVSRPARAG